MIYVAHTLRPALFVAVLLVAGAFASAAVASGSASTTGAGTRVHGSVVPGWLSDPAAGGPTDPADDVPLQALDVTDFGAIGDGIADDMVAIQTAIDAANADGGGTVFMPRGVYAVSGPVWMRSNVELAGAGEGSVIVADGDYVGVIYLGNPENVITDTILRDLTVRGSGNPINTGNTLISMNRHVERAWIDHVWMDQAGYDAWNALMDTRQVYVTRCRVTGAGDDGLNPGGSGGGPNQSTRDIVLSQNHISGAANDGIHVSFNSVGVQASGNTIVDSGVGIGIFHSSYSSIKDNVIRDCGTGIRNHAVGSHHLVISGNLIDSTTSGPGIDFGNDHERVEITGNTILFPAEGAAHGIEEIDGQHVTIRDNVIQGASDGIRITSGDHTVVAGNIVTQSQNGVVFDASDGILSGNSIVDVDERGILLPGDSGQARNLVTGNVVRNAGQGGIFVAASETVITGNHVLDLTGLSIEDLGLGNTIVNNYVDTSVSVAPSARVVHIDAEGRAGFGVSNPQHALDVDGDVSADAMRLAADRFRIFAGADGLYVEDTVAGTVGRILLTNYSPITASGKGRLTEASNYVEVERRPTHRQR